MRPVNLFAHFSTWLLPYKNVVVVYRLTWGGQHYIGSSRNVYSRMSWWQLHFRNKNIVDVRVKILLVCCEEDRFYYEERLIGALRPKHNKTHTGKGGGVLGKPCSEAAKRKISEKNTGHKFSESAKLQMSESAKRRGPHVPAVYAAIADKNRGAIRTPEMRARISASVIGKPKSEAHKAALKEAWKRRKLNHNQGETT